MNKIEFSEICGSLLLSAIWEIAFGGSIARIINELHDEIYCDFSAIIFSAVFALFCLGLECLWIWAMIKAYK